ncbi:unnamed protein product [Calypogeia fissa]
MASTSPPWWSKDTVAVVTGANKGVGYEIARLLAEQGLTVVLTARDVGRGQAAIDALNADGQKSIHFYPLDVKSLESVESLANWLKTTFGGIDILVNNAAVALGPNGIGSAVEYGNAKDIVETNYYGVKNVTDGLLPLLRPSPAAARIVNVTSGVGLYEFLRAERLKQMFRGHEENYTIELVDSLAEKYLEDVRTGKWDEEGWVEEGEATYPMYSESKMFLNAYNIALAKSLLKSQPEDHQILVAAFTPGVTQTDLYIRAARGGFMYKQPASQGADTGVWLALLPKEELAQKTGKFFKNRAEWGFGSKSWP